MTVNTLISAQTLSAHTPAATPVLTGGDYHVVRTTLPGDIRDAQALRYRVFTEEPGYSAAIGDRATGLDADRFDAYCDHFLVRHLPTGELAGCVRVLPPPRAIAAGGWYSAGEFDLTGLQAIAAETVEMGRAVVGAAHRSGTVTALLWATVLDYLEQGGCRYLMGCVSVPLGSGADRGRDLRGVRDLTRDDYAARWRVTPYREVTVGGASLDDIDPVGRPRLPALLRGYVRLGARVCGEPAFDEVFDVGDLLTVIDVEEGDRRYLDRLRGAVARLAVRED